MEKNIVLSNKIYIPYTEELFLSLHDELTYRFDGKTPTSPPETISTLTKIGTRALLIPIGRKDLIPDGYTIIDKRVTPKVNIPKPKFILRDTQQKFVDLVNEEEDTWILNAKPGWGKSFTLAGLAYKLQVKTLVVVHTVKLRKQWAEDIEKQFGFKPGIIGSGIENAKPPIVIANVQTFNKVASKYQNSFGLVALDECHHTPSTTFTKIIANTRAKYRVGLTATIERRDRKQILTLDYFGRKNIYRPPKENTMDPLVVLYRVPIRLPGSMMTPWPIRINKLTAKREYIATIVNLTNALIERKRKVLIVSDRVDFLNVCSSYIHESVCITAKTEDQEELQKQVEIGEKSAIFGSVNIYKEGISENYLDALILAVPIASEPLLEQIVGRIQRQYKNKPTPEIYDICLEGETADNQLSIRMAFYIRSNFEIIDISVS